MKSQENFLTSAITNTSQKIRLSEQFWTQFTESIWEKETLAIPNSFINTPIAVNDLFSIITNDLNVTNNFIVSKRFYIEGNKQQLEGADYYPKLEDKSFIGYDRRICSLCGNKEYVLIIDALLVNYSLWDWTYKFLQNLYNSLGFLNYGHFWSIFYGNYSKTPFGVHDHNYPGEPAQSAFYFPIEGNKSMRIWTPEFVKRNKQIRRSTQYEKFLEDSTLLKAEAGGMLYWPSDRWHIGDSKGGDVSLVIAIDNSNNFVEPLAYILKEEIEKIYGNSLKKHLLEKIGEVILKFSRRKGNKKAFFDSNNLQKSADNIPDAIQSAAKVFKYFIDSSVVEIASTKLWLSMLTGYGFMPLISEQFLETKWDLITSTDYIEVSPNRQILWRKVGKNEIAIAVNGIPTVFPLYRNIEKIIETINSGDALSVKIILENSDLANKDEHRDYSVEGILGLLNTLLGNGGIKIIK
ncbi:hypothetical protein [Nostoc sp. 'Lobaria pulmonaria (5183) cyanobiont']|uniref:hypothetical protein n=1 Tax=Nostoc sp. 'Lobaria pulmonaria (5183) cyanobiont' TaxID=1618022 RepID=UPI000CF35CC3|nr:hypothetical protein [Nostoc sp. 'Lobaria pulmonaria (5183) cyanobiont']AVH69216.1 hypothetical protein NLP_0301 [Nostoc sp. 'Lobaria pulmonaria (5183) cyanobiont']